MHDIKTMNKIRYEGLKSKLIHLEPKVFELLTACAKIKKLNLKVYIETLCNEQAKYEAREAIAAIKKNKNNQKKEKN